MCQPFRFLDEIDPELLQIGQAGGFVPPPRGNRWSDPAGTPAYCFSA